MKTKTGELKKEHLEVIHAALKHYYHDGYALHDKDLIVETFGKITMKQLKASNTDNKGKENEGK